jgi:hypothetical protein
VRDAYNHDVCRILRWLTTTYPLGRIYEAQVRWTETYAQPTIAYIQEIFASKHFETETLADSLHRDLFFVSGKLAANGSPAV